jgi:hypothetical protein
MLTNKLSSLRAHMRDIGVKFFLVLSNDAHASEYVSASDGKDKNRPTNFLCVVNFLALF